MNIYTFPQTIQFAQDKTSNNYLLADMNHADSKEYSSWKQKIKSKPQKFQNLPMLGFKIIKQNDNHNVLKDSISILHPHGFSFEISSQNFLSIVTNNSINSCNEIMGSMILCYQKNKNEFNFHLASEVFYQQNSSKTSTNELKPGQQYFIKNEKEPYYYIGYKNFFSHHFPQYKDNTILIERKKKAHLFVKNTLGFNYIKSFPITKVIKSSNNSLSSEKLQQIIDNEQELYPMKTLEQMFTHNTQHLEYMKKALLYNLLWAFDFSKEYGSRSFNYLTFTPIKNNLNEYLFNDNVLFTIGSSPNSSKDFQKNLNLNLHSSIADSIFKFFKLNSNSIRTAHYTSINNRHSNEFKDFSYNNNKHIFTILNKHESQVFNINLNLQDIYNPLILQLIFIFENYNNNTNLTETLSPIFEDTINKIIQKLQYQFLILDFSSTNKQPYSYNIFD